MEREFLRGVNLGGWLLLEKWMTPSLFHGLDAKDEYTFMQAPGAAEKIEAHRNSFITEDDFAWLAAHGVNAVRIPIGYWVYEDELPYHSALSHLDWAMDMAEKYELKVLLDLHGLPGSQNGKDHSGKIGKSEWFRYAVHRDQSTQVLLALARRYAHCPSLWGMQLINEPRLGIFHRKLRRFYRNTYKALTQVLPPHVAVVVSDAYTPRLMNGVLKAVGNPVVLDVHLYHMATLLARHRSLDWFFEKTKRRKKMIQRLSRTQPIIIGEWSGVMSHETMRTIPKEKQRELFAKYVALQQEVFSESTGWFYWNYKTEKPGEWSFRSQVEAGLIHLPD